MDDVLLIALLACGVLFGPKPARLTVLTGFIAVAGVCLVIGLMILADT